MCEQDGGWGGYGDHTMNTNHNAQLDALEPCPFCGESSDLTVRVYEHHDDAYVQCRECTTCGPDGGDRAGAIAKWNHRSQPMPEAAAQGWKPIETAPKDGTPILVTDSFIYRNDPKKKQHHVYRAVFWNDEGGWEIYNDGEVIDEDGPTYWMPLVEPGSASPAAPDVALQESPLVDMSEEAVIARCLPQPQAQGALTGCACRWDREGNRMQTCVRHQGWLDVVHEWAERAKSAEAESKSYREAIAEKDAALVACVEALQRYGIHDGECSYDPSSSTGAGCSCGFSSAITQANEALGRKDGGK